MRSEQQEVRPFYEFLKTSRRVAVVFLVAWMLVTVARTLQLEPSRDKFSPPTPPFQAVSSQTGQSHAPTQQTGVGSRIVHDILQMILYSPR